MSTKTFRGGATAVGQIDSLTVGGTVEVTDLFKLTIGNKTVTVAAGSTTPATVAPNIVNAINALTAADHGGFVDVLAIDGSGGSFHLEARWPGRPFTCSVETTEGDESPADDQTFSNSTTQASSGPEHWTTAANWDAGAVPISGDAVVIDGLRGKILYGLDQGAVSLASLTIRNLARTGEIGLPRWNPRGYPEYRPQYLAIGADAITIEDTTALGSGRIKIDHGTQQTAVVISAKGSPAETGVPAILLQGSHASNTLTITRGNVGVAFFSAETAGYDTTILGSSAAASAGATLRLGSGAAVASITKNSGVLETYCNLTTLNQRAGTVSVLGAASVGTLTASGIVRYKSSGTLTSATLRSGAVLDFRGSAAARTVVDLVAPKGAKVYDPNGTTTFTNPIQLKDCLPNELVLQLGSPHSVVPMV